MKSRIVRLASLLLLTVAIAAAQGAPVSCSDPDALCTGDPCVVPRVEVEDPCVVDFGARDVVLEGLKQVRRVALTAKSFRVAGAIGGSDQDQGSPVTLSLVASDGIAVDAPIQIVLFDSPFLVELSAGADIAVDAPISLTKTFVQADPGDGLLLDAGGDLAVRAPLTTKFAGRAIELRSGGKTEVSGLIGARANADSGVQPVWIDAGGDVVLDASVAGALNVVSGGAVELRKPVSGDWQLSIQAVDGVVVAAPFRSSLRFCPSLEIDGGTGPVQVLKSLRCEGPITVASDADVTVEGTVQTQGDITITSAAGHTTVSGKLQSRPIGVVSGGRDVTVSGASVTVDVSRVDNRSQSHAQAAGGRQEFTATAGDMILRGRFAARNGGTIVGSATGNLTAEGRFEVGTPNVTLPCIGMEAGGVLDVSGALFDLPPVAACP
jgi:hypothetical protein